MGKKDRIRVGGGHTDASGGATASASADSQKSPSAISSAVSGRSGQKSALSTDQSDPNNKKSSSVGGVNNKQQRSFSSSDKAKSEGESRSHSHNASPKHKEKEISRRNGTSTTNNNLEDDQVSVEDMSVELEPSRDENGISTAGEDAASKNAKGQKKRDRKAAKAKKDMDKDFVPQSPVASLADRAVALDQRRKKNDDYVADLKHKGLHSMSGDIERCLKKVSDGIETFEDILQKVHNATSINQKEKCKADLKKEIKKLQHLRDLIRPWIASGEIKDKSNLVDTMELILKLMERFKVIERETKTKAYSKVGLEAAQKLDPTTREREDLNCWLSASIDSMQIQMDQFECEIESILAAKKKKLDKDKQDRLDELKTCLERHRFHVGKLETLMRMLDNLAVDVNAVRYTSSLPQQRKFLSQVKKIKDDIYYYLESNQEPEFEENEFLYDDIEGLEEFDDGLVGQPLGGLNATEEELLVDGTPALTTAGNISPISPVHSSDASDPEKKRVVTLENGLISPPPLQQDTSSNNLLLNSSSSIGSGMLNSSHHHHLFGDSAPSESTNSSQQQHPSYLGQQTLTGFAAAAMAAASAGLGISNNLSESGLATNISNLGDSNSSSLISNSSRSNSNSSSVVLGGSSNVIGLTSNVGGNQQNRAVGGSNFNSAVSSLVNATTTATSSAGSVAPVGLRYSSSTSNSNGSRGGISSHNSSSGILSQQQLQQLQQQHQGPTNQSGNSRDTTVISDYLRLHQSQDQMLLNRILTEPESTASLKSMAQGGVTLGEHNSSENKMREAQIPPLLGVAPLGPVPLQKEHQFQFQMMESAHFHLPVSADSERMRQFLPRNPYPTPHYYPQNPLTSSDTLEFFQELSIETLFFIFYYLEGTKAQFLAANALNIKSWRFHTKYVTWFQRHEEPNVINEEYEQGTYIYFDIEEWGLRKKDGFVFEYRYLEGRELE